MKSLERSVMKRSGAYVMFGHAKRSNAIYINTLKRLKKTKTLRAAISSEEIETYSAQIRVVDCVVTSVQLTAIGSN